MAALMGGMGMRTIWITLRAINYTERVFREVIRGVEGLSKSQKELNQEQLRNLRIGNALIMTGMMMASIGQMMAQNLWQLVLSTREGAIEMEILKQEMEETKIAFADSIYEILKVTGVLDILHSTLEVLRQNELLRKGAVILLAIAAGALILVGGIMLLAGAMMSWEVVSARLPALLKILDLAMLKHTISVHGASIAWWELSLAMGAGVGVFFMLKDVLGPIPAAIIAVSLAVAVLAVKLWSAAAAVSILTAGIAAGLGVAAFMAALDQSRGAAGFEVGTRGLPYTGLFVGHKGEVIYNPATRRPVQVANEIERGGFAGEPRTVFQEMPVTIEHVHTKADFDDFDEKLRKAHGKMARKRR